MSLLTTPDKVSFDVDRKSSILAWDNKESQARFGGRYWMRGGICWPREYVRTDPTQPPVMGVALVVGQRDHDQHCVIFECEPFVCVDHILDGSGGIEYKGLSTWFNRQWANYFIDTYYCADTPDVFLRYQAQVLRSPMIKPKPVFSSIKWASWEDARHILWQRLALHQLSYRKGSMVHTEAQKLKDSDGQRVAHPAVLAILASLTGFEQRPPRRRRV